MRKKNHALITMILCMAVYAIQIIVPCGRCMTVAESSDSFCNTIECGSCQNGSHSDDEEPVECLCEPNVKPAVWLGIDSDQKLKAPDVTVVYYSAYLHFSTSSTNLFQYPMLDRPPPVGRDQRIVFGVFLV